MHDMRCDGPQFPDLRTVAAENEKAKRQDQQWSLLCAAAIPLRLCSGILQG